MEALTTALDEWFAAEYAARSDNTDDWGGARARKQIIADKRRTDLVAQLVALAQAYGR